MIARHLLLSILFTTVIGATYAQTDTTHYHVHKTDHHQKSVTDTAHVTHPVEHHHWAPIIHSHSGRLPEYIALPEPGTVAKKEDEE